MEESNWYLYRHLKPSGEVFYIGIGKTNNFKRAYEKHNRNNWWHNTVKKYSNYEVQVLTTGLTKYEACELEKVLISWYKRADCCEGTLVNLTDGGEGVSNIVQSEESKKKRADKIRVLYKGEGNPFHGKTHSEETKKFISDYQKRFYEYTETFPENITRSVPRKSSRPVIHLVTNKVNKSLREASQYYGIPNGIMKYRMAKGRHFNGNLWYLDEFENTLNQAIEIIRFLEISAVRDENIYK